MATTYTNRDTDWYIRNGAGVSELNGCGFAPFLAGAGVNYADQDAPQVNIDNATITASSATTTLTFLTGYTVTGNEVGNVFRLASGTGLTADYYLITGASVGGNTWTFDRSPGATGSAIVGRMGGAAAHIRSFANSTGQGTGPVLASPLVNGNNIYVKGTVADPSSVEYDWSDGYWSFIAGGGVSTGNIRLIGYPAGTRPLVGHRGIAIYDWKYSAVENIKFKQTASNFTGNGIAPIGYNTAATSFTNCIFDQAGFDSKQILCGNNSNASGSVMGCEVRNSGSTAAGTSNAVELRHCGGLHYMNWVHGVRGNAYTSDAVGGAMICNVINSNNGDALRVTHITGADATADIGPLVLMNNTINANGGHAFNFAVGGANNSGANVFGVLALFNNIITNHAGASKYALTTIDAKSVNLQKYKELVGFNNYYGNTTDFASISSVPVWSVDPVQDGALIGDLAVDPAYTNAGTSDFTPGASMKGVGVAKSALFTQTDYKLNLGAVFT